MAWRPSPPAHAAPRTESDPADRPTDDHIVRTATEARQGEIILGRRGRWVWIAAFLIMLVIIVAFLFAY